MDLDLLSCSLFTLLGHQAYRLLGPGKRSVNEHLVQKDLFQFTNLHSIEQRLCRTHSGDWKNIHLKKRFFFFSSNRSETKILNNGLLVNFMLFGAGYFCFPIYVFELCSGICSITWKQLDSFGFYLQDHLLGPEWHYLRNNLVSVFLESPQMLRTFHLAGGQREHQKSFLLILKDGSFPSLRQCLPHTHPSVFYWILRGDPLRFSL